jgi:mannose-6-phosphate isomerase
MTSTLRPVILDPVIVAKPWGGRRLADLGRLLPPSGTYGESWDVADLSAEAVTSSERTRSTVAVGPDAGRSLRDLIDAYGADLLGSAPRTASGNFPLLLKFLDAHEHLSVQVHPNERYVSRHPGTRLKTESWYVVDAMPAAVIYKGVRSGVTMDDVRRAAGTSAFVELLNPVHAEPGDFHHLPAGIIHALGAGVLVAEPQTPSDTTFRIYDWADEYGRAPRTLHIEEGLETIDLAPEGAVFLTPITGEGSRTLIETRHYWQVEHKRRSGPLYLDPARELRILTVISGTATLRWGDGLAMELGTGATVLIPAVVAPESEIELTSEGVVIETGLVPRA